MEIQSTHHDLKTLIPPFYYDAKGELSAEVDAIVSAEEKVFNDLFNPAIQKVWSNLYVQTADADGLTAIENVLAISSTTESLDFRRLRALNRMSTRAPFTLPYLRKRLDTILGADKYKLYIDYDAQTLYIEAAAVNQSWYEEIYITMNNIKPAHIAFVNKPILFDTVKSNEIINLNQFIYNYKAGTTAKTSEVLPVAEYKDMGTVKGGNILSIDPNLLKLAAGTTATNIAKVVINDSLTITTFSIKTYEDNKAVIEYKILDGTVSEVNNIKFKDAADKTLTNANVFVPANGDTIFKHTITFEEGTV